MVLRRPGSDQQSQMLKLRGLNPQASYELTNLDPGLSRTLLGAELATPGLEVPLPRKPDSALIRYRAAK